MFPNAKGSELLAVLATINPSSQGAGTANSGWISMANFHEILAVIQTGTLGASATVDAKIQQATDSSGTSAKDVTGKAITQLTSGNNKQMLINLRAQELDVANSFNYVQLSITVGTAATGTSAVVLGLNPRFATADALNQAGVVQVVS